VNAARRPVVGAERVAHFVLGITSVAGLAVYERERISMVVSLTVRAGRITRLDFVLAPEKLPH
jgi:RNA polymerase sigma-70 factor (ECF subfamily)